jgi:pyruvate dehydrogenase E2 component (dihydrolipoamide acetyltransferase)
VRAAPFVRQRARELGVDLARVVGTGPDGRVTRSDVEAAAQGSRVEADGDQRISVVGIRKAIARQMLRSVTTIPQFTEFAVFDATGLLADRERRKQAGQSVTPLPYFVRAVVRATRDHPMLNSTWDEAHDEIVVKRAIHVGLAVNTPQGLLVPVLRDADQLDLQQIAARASELIAGARAGSLPPRDMTGSTITVTNVGASGPVETGTPIINPPECCVVGFGAIRPRPMVIDGQVVARPGAWISISVDHRIVDGALATEFLTTLVRYLEEPVA